MVNTGITNAAQETMGLTFKRNIIQPIPSIPLHNQRQTLTKVLSKNNDGSVVLPKIFIYYPKSSSSENIPSTRCFKSEGNASSAAQLRGSPETPVSSSCIPPSLNIPSNDVPMPATQSRALGDSADLTSTLGDTATLPISLLYGADVSDSSEDETDAPLLNALVRAAEVELADSSHLDCPRLPISAVVHSPGQQSTHVKSLSLALPPSQTLSSEMSSDSVSDSSSEYDESSDSSDYECGLCPAMPLARFSRSHSASVQVDGSPESSTADESDHDTSSVQIPPASGKPLLLSLDEFHSMITVSLSL